MKGRHSRRDEKGQAIVILAVSIAVLLGITALVIDGGDGVVQQRATQSAVDAAAVAGATVMVENVGDPGSQTSGDAMNAIQQAFNVNSALLETATYARYDFSEIGPVSSAGSIPVD